METASDRFDMGAIGTDIVRRRAERRTEFRKRAFISDIGRAQRPEDRVIHHGVGAPCAYLTETGARHSVRSSIRDIRCDDPRLIQRQIRARKRIIRTVDHFFRARRSPSAPPLAEEIAIFLRVGEKHSRHVFYHHAIGDAGFLRRLEIIGVGISRHLRRRPVTARDFQNGIVESYIPVGNARRLERGRHAFALPPHDAGKLFPVFAAGDRLYPPAPEIGLRETAVLDVPRPAVATEAHSGAVVLPATDDRLVMLSFRVVIPVSEPVRDHRLVERGRRYAHRNVFRLRFRVRSAGSVKLLLEESGTGLSVFLPPFGEGVSGWREIRNPVTVSEKELRFFDVMKFPVRQFVPADASVFVPCFADAETADAQPLLSADIHGTAGNFLHFGYHFTFRSGPQPLHAHAFLEKFIHSVHRAVRRGAPETVNGAAVLVASEEIQIPPVRTHLVLVRLERTVRQPEPTGRLGLPDVIPPTRRDSGHFVLVHGLQFLPGRAFDVIGQLCRRIPLDRERIRREDYFACGDAHRQNRRRYMKNRRLDHGITQSFPAFIFPRSHHIPVSQSSVPEQTIRNP